MKKILVLLVALAVLALPGLAAAEGFVWLVDPKTGCQVGFPANQYIKDISVAWSGGVANGKAEGPGQILRIYEITFQGKTTRYTMQGSAEMRQVIMNGQVSLRWSVPKQRDEMYEGAMENGQKNGFGVMKYSEGDSHEGDWKDDIPHGKALCRGPSGRITHQGFYENGAPVKKPFAGKVVPSIGGLLDAFQGVPWGAGEDAVKAAIKSLENVTDSGSNDLDVKGCRALYYQLKLADGRAQIRFQLVDDKLASGIICWYVDREDDVLPKFETVKASLFQKYGMPDKEDGKFLDKQGRWYFGVPETYSNSIVLWMDVGERQNVDGQKIPVYKVVAGYSCGALTDMINSKSKKQQGVSL